jgi:GT2 family glycosyltransferase
VNDPTTSIVVPVHNRASLTRQCLSVLTSTLPEAVEIVVVDDGSTDITPEMLETYGARIRVIRHDEARGFASACNDGAAAARGRFIVLLNNDTIPQPGWLDALLTHAERYPAAAAVGAKLLFPNDTIQHAGVVICADRSPRHIYMGFPSDHPAVNKSRRFQVVTAACVLLRRDAFEAVGGLDEDFHNGFEDVDLCLRIGEHGHEVWYCHRSVLHHFEKGTRSDERFEENLSLYRRRWARKVQPDEFDYYLADDLLKLSYGHQYPLRMEIAPELAVLEREDEWERNADRLLAERSRQVFVLLRENLEIKLRDGDAAADLSEDDEPRAMKAALFVSAEPADPKRYRCDHQAEQLAMLGVSVDVMRTDDVRWGEVADRYGLFVLHRVAFDDDLRWFIGVARRQGKRVIFDTDDLVFDPGALRAHFAGLEHLDATERRAFEHRVERSHESLRSADAATTSTEPLAELARRVNEQVYVTPNTVSGAMIEQADAALAGLADAEAGREDVVTIAYMSGTPTHDRDFLEAAEAVRTVLDEFEATRLLVVGDLRLGQEFAGLRERIRRVPFQPWYRLPELMAQVDINLAPLEAGNPFTESKSCIKYFEAALVGVPTVASPRSDFRRVIEHGRNGLLADTPEEWLSALTELVSSGDRRRSIGRTAYEDVRANHTTRAWARSLLTTFVDAVGSRASTTFLRINVVSAVGAARRERSLAESLAAYLRTRGHRVESVSIAGRNGDQPAEQPVADASIATDAVAAAFVAADERSLFRFNVIADRISAVPSVARLPLRNVVLDGIPAEAFRAENMLEPDRVAGGVHEALDQIEELVREACFVRLTRTFESEDATVLTPTRRT